MHPRDDETPPKVDRRVLRTRRLLREALIVLTLERGWDKVTIRDVCERSDVGRSTFYLHFADKEELLFSGFEALRSHLQRIRRAAKGKFAFVEELIAHAADNVRLFRAVVGKRSGATMQRRFRDVVVELVEADLAHLSIPNARRALVARYLSGAFVEMLLFWLDQPSSSTGPAVAAEFRRLSAGALGHRAES